MTALMTAPGLSLELRQLRKLSQTLTPALQQSIKLLQLSSFELDAVVREALETNPLLSLDESQEDSPVEAPKTLARDPAAGYRPTPTGARLFGAVADAPPGAERHSAQNDAPGPDRPEAAPERTLQDALFEDIAFSFDDSVERTVAMDLSGLLDEAGYLAGDVGDVAAFRGVSEALVSDILLRLQALAPPGLFARNLAECLRLQLADVDALDPSMEALLDNLPLLTERGPEALSAAADIDPDDLPRQLDRLRVLDPRPGLAFAGGAAPAIVPDLIVRPATDALRCDGEQACRLGQWVVAVNPDTTPRLALDRAGLDRLRARARDESEKAYLRDRPRRQAGSSRLSRKGRRPSCAWASRYSAGSRNSWSTGLRASGR